MDIQLSKYLEEYVNRMRPRFPSVQPDTAHGIASAFLAFRYGLYTKAELECTNALRLAFEGDAGSALRKALTLVKKKAQDLDNARITTGTDIPLTFTDNERQFIAIVLPPDKIEDPVTLELDNALILLYAVAMITSPDDEETLEEHRKYITTILSSYKTALGLG